MQRELASRRARGPHVAKSNPAPRIRKQVEAGGPAAQLLLPDGNLVALGRAEQGDDQLRRLGADPASASAPFVATLVDVTGLMIYFTVALAVLRGTVL